MGLRSHWHSVSSWWLWCMRAAFAWWSPLPKAQQAACDFKLKPWRTMSRQRNKQLKQATHDVQSRYRCMKHNLPTTFWFRFVNVSVQSFTDVPEPGKCHGGLFCRWVEWYNYLVGRASVVWCQSKEWYMGGSVAWRSSDDSKAKIWVDQGCILLSAPGPGIPVTPKVGATLVCTFK